MRFTQHHHGDYYLDKGQGHRLLSLQDLVDLSFRKNLSHFAKAELLHNFVTLLW